MFGPALTLVLALASSTVIAVPMVDNVYKRAVASLDPSSTEFPFYFPESVYESIPHSGAPPSPSSETDDTKTATDFISKRLNLGADDFKVVDSYTDPFDQHLAKRDLTVSAPEATVSFARGVCYCFRPTEIPVYSEFEHVLESLISPRRLRTRVVPLPRRDAHSRVFSVSNLSLRDLHQRDGLLARSLRGNNVITSNPRGKTTRAIRDGVFNTKFDSKERPATIANIAAAAVNLFYVANVMHDISYQYGFTEQAGNFQKSNFGKGGKGQ
ncbi:hypothetical protein BASA60_007135 [Batrachochytrium salamandrivorans]|nr:hypothetical protein BASA60_007135 [Batrachochytrium salamandrivorans]